MKRFISDQFFYLTDLTVRSIPGGILRRLLRALHQRSEVAARVGYQVYPDVFYNPFPSAAEIDLAQLKLKRPLPGVTFDLPKSQSLLAELTRFAPEVKQFLADRPATMVARWDITYPRGDAAILYSMLRHLKPRRYIEVGCGYSTRCSTAALHRNADDSAPCQSLFIEPFPPPYLTELKLPGEFLQKKIQQVPLARFQELQSGDVLFIDTSHVIKCQNDVEYELLQILPSLNPGVVIHIHDIFTPYDYPEEWLVGNHPNRGGNNEQYALECLLSAGGPWRVLLPSFLLWKDHPDLFRNLVESDFRPASFWITKTD